MALKDDMSIVPMAFPHHIGPGTRGLSTALLFHGRLAMTLPAWLAPGPIEAIRATARRAEEQSHPLQDTLRLVEQHFALAQKQAIAEMQAITPFKNRLPSIMAVYPGTAEAYAFWDPVRDECLQVLTLALRDPIQMSTAAMELIWRIWEHALEQGHDPDSPTDFDADEILDYFQRRAVMLGGPTALLAESALNRYIMPCRTEFHFATNSEVSVAVLAHIGNLLTYETEDAAAQREALAFFLFDRLAYKYVGPLYPSTITRISSMFLKRGEALASMKAKCFQEADNLLARPPVEAQLENAVMGLLRKMEEEVTDIAELDRKTVRSCLEELAQDSKVWATVAGFLGGLGSLPAPVVASLGITALSIIGAGATKAGLSRQRKFRGSAWRFLYYANHS